MGRELPENSLAALREAMVNADGIEFDLRLTCDGHVVLNFSVTLLAKYAGLYVTLVWEVYEIRKVMNFDPRDFFFFVELVPQVFDVVLCVFLATFDGNFSTGVAVHTDLRSRNPCVDGTTCIGVTVLTFNL